MITEKWSQYIILALIGAIVIVGAFGFLRPTVINQLEEENRLSVTGTATLSAAPDEVVILAGAETLAAEADDSQRANAGLISAIRSALERKGLTAENVTTASYYLEIAREWNKTTERMEIVGYRTVHILKIKSSNLNKAGDYVDAAVSGGANRVDSVTFGLSTAKEADYRKQALEQAGANARERADAAAQGLGVRVTRVVRASEGYVSIVPYTRALAAEAATEITPGQVEVSASVSVTYEIA
ncbi:MAG: SIMPL domain-containing protein [Candidatus Aenigmatarchaeota archaeon]